ncbi:MAG: porin family protein [Candidatus Zixiibacteriota bacterium]
MKKIAPILQTIIFTIVLASVPLSAKEINANRTLDGGLLAGISSSIWAGNPNTAFGEQYLLGYDYNWRIRFGFAVGAFADLRIDSHFGIRMELLYVQKGCVENERLYGSKDIFRFDYVEIPLLVKFAPSPRSKIRPSISIGPFLDQYLRSELESNPSSDILGFHRYLSKEKIRKSCYGIVLGGGIDFPSGKGMMSIEIRLELGLSSTWNYAPNPSPNLRTNSLLLLTGYSFSAL